MLISGKKIPKTSVVVWPGLFFKGTFEFCHLLLADKAQHHPSSPRPSPSPIPPVRLWLPRCSHGGDEDEVPLSEKGEAGSGTVAALLGCHSGRSANL